jgi:hypothetical protein
VSAATSTCKECGCTDDDCRQCIERTGHPCTWANDTFDLCTACEDRPAVHEIAESIAEATVLGGEPSAIDQLAREVLLLVQERDAARARVAPLERKVVHRDRGGVASNA